MSGKNKTTLAIILGVVGILLGILGTITAYNAKDNVDSDAEETREVRDLVDQRFTEAQDRQDRIEANQRSEAEKLVAQLTRGERDVLQKINGTHRRIGKLKQRLDTLSNRDRQLAGEIDRVERDQSAGLDRLNQRINRSNSQIQRLQRQVSNLRGFLGN